MRRKKPEGEGRLTAARAPPPGPGRAWVCGGSMPRATQCLGERAFAPSSLAQPDPSPGASSFLLQPGKGASLPPNPERTPSLGPTSHKS